MSKKMVFPFDKYPYPPYSMLGYNRTRDQGAGKEGKKKKK